VRPQDADNVAEGMDATISFDVLNARDTPRLKGSVVLVSRDALQDERTGESYFEARIAIPNEEAHRIPPQAFAPGLPVDVLVHGGSRSLLQYLFAPLDRAAFRALRET
jgi:hypothetical protein